MAIFEGTYNPLLDGVSQQTPQERRDGQLSSQTNMVSDKVAGLRRRGGIALDRMFTFNPDGYFRIVKVLGVDYIICIDHLTGDIRVENFKTKVVVPLQNDYFIATSKKAFKTVMSKDNFFIVNTEKVPTKEVISSTRKNPKDFGYFSVRGGSFGRTYTVEIKHGTLGGTKTYSAITSSTEADMASAEFVATALLNAINFDSSVTGKLTAVREGTTVSIEITDKSTSEALDIQSTSVSGGFMAVSGTSRVSARSELLPTLTTPLDGYTMAVGNTGNSVYYQYNHTTKRWAEVGVYEPAYKIKDEPMYIEFPETGIVLKTLGIKQRSAGDEDNNPEPSFIDFGITGIGAYQSRLVLLSGAYVNFSKTNSFDEYMRTSVAELLDDDSIEVSNSTLSSAQFEYCIPFNKDLILVAQDQQAVIPANNTVLTPRTAVIYTSTDLDLSLSVSPASVGRTVYYVYQRGTDYYQVGEFIPNSYTDGQYYNQNLTDHIPLYAEGVCTTMASSSTNNMVICGSDRTEVLVNQYMWSGDERVQMAFHKWIYPYPVMYAQFIQEYLITFMDGGDGVLIVGSQNVQLNQLRTKPIPYLDIYSYVDIVDGEGTLPTNYYQETTKPIKGVIYDSLQRRHKEVAISIADGKVKCAYTGQIALGTPFESEITLTPPFMKDDQGRVIAGARSKVVSIRLTMENSGGFKAQVRDAFGIATDRETTPTIWGEVGLGTNWVNGIGDINIPCRTRMNSTEYKISTDLTTDINVVSAEYILKVPTRRRRL